MYCTRARVGVEPVPPRRGTRVRGRRCQHYCRGDRDEPLHPATSSNGSAHPSQPPTRSCSPQPYASGTASARWPSTSLRGRVGRTSSRSTVVKSTWRLPHRRVGADHGGRVPAALATAGLADQPHRLCTSPSGSVTSGRSCGGHSPSSSTPIGATSSVSRCSDHRFATSWAIWRALVRLRRACAPGSSGHVHVEPAGGCSSASSSALAATRGPARRDWRVLPVGPRSPPSH